MWSQTSINGHAAEEEDTYLLQQYSSKKLFKNTITAIFENNFPRVSKQKNITLEVNWVCISLLFKNTELEFIGFYLIPDWVV